MLDSTSLAICPNWPSSRFQRVASCLPDASIWSRAALDAGFAITPFAALKKPDQAVERPVSAPVISASTRDAMPDIWVSRPISPALSSCRAYTSPSAKRRRLSTSTPWPTFCCDGCPGLDVNSTRCRL